MAETKVPTKLGREPIADVTFEIRFQGAAGGAGVLPGLLFARLAGVERIEPLPAAQVPEQFRALDPSFKYVGLNRVHWQQYLIVIGENSLAFGCKLPYPGWTSFRPAIFEVLKHVSETPFVEVVERASLKYINLFEPVHRVDDGQQQFNIEITVGGTRVGSENTQLRVELPRGPFLHAVTYASAANLIVGGVATPKSGAILDVDTLAMNLNMPTREFMGRAPVLLEELHQTNHEVFFGCLTPAAIEKLEPKYE